MGVVKASFAKPLAVIRRTAIIDASATVNLVPIWSGLGWGTLRGVAYADVAGTLSFWEKQRSGTFRQSNSLAIAAATGTPFEFLVSDEYWRLRYVNGGTVQAEFQLFAALEP